MPKYAFDVETTGLNPYKGDRIFCWVLSTNKSSKFYLKTPSNLRHLKHVLNNPNNTVVMHNMKFDLKMLTFEGIDIFKLKAEIHCTLLLSKVLDSVETTHNLRYLSRKHLHKDCTDKDRVEEWIKSNKRCFSKEHNREPTFRDAPIELVKRRAMWDTNTTLELFQKLYPQAERTCLDLYNTERQLTFVCIDMENTGVLVNITKAKELRAQAQKTLNQILKDLNKLVCPLLVRHKKKGKMMEVIVKEFNPGSPIHLPAAFTKLRIDLKYKTKPKKKKGGGKTGGGNWCFDEYAMIRYVSKPLAAVIYKSGIENWGAHKFYNTTHRIIKKHNLSKRELLPPLVIKYRELSKMISTYYNHLIEDCIDVYKTPTGEKIGTLHCQFNQSVAMTGRFSSSKPNLQNMPRLLGPRECFICRKGRRNWHFDYEQVEMRFYVHFSKDKKMASRLSTDLHRHTASDMYSKEPEDITKEERERAGSINFAVIYGAGAKTMAETLSRKGSPTTENQALRFITKYNRIYPSVKRTARILARQLRKIGYIVNPFGRRYYIPKALSYKALNYMCQGTSADQIKRAMVETFYWLRRNGFRTKLIMTIHDELVFEIPYAEEKRAVPKIIEMMEDLTNYTVPITVGIDIATKQWSQKFTPEELGLHWVAA